MVEFGESYWEIAESVTIVFATALANVFVGIGSSRIEDTFRRVCTIAGTICVTAFIIMMLVVLPWSLDLTEDTESLMNIVISLIVLGAGFGIGILLWKCLKYVEGEAGKIRQTDIEVIKSTITSKCNETENKLIKHSDDSIEKIRKNMKEDYAKHDKLDDCSDKIDQLQKDVQEIKDNQIKNESIQESLEKISEKQNDPNGRIDSLEKKIDAISETIHSDKSESEKNPTTNEIPRVADVNEKVSHIVSRDESFAKYGFNLTPSEESPYLSLVSEQDGTAIALICEMTIHGITQDSGKKIERKTYLSELKLAEKKNMPFVLHVTNAQNGRRWMMVVSPENIQSWPGDKIPDALGYNDEESRQALETEYRETMKKLGGVVKR